ncbi:M56 family metallopeptidase [Paenibacillus sp. NPDC058071]|uniref:M56 family metallopeptidase n=1 Tax=Paenibacillus sp. NPDC058071 TaxID=3346326 RepID=UPI0036DCC4FB
MSFLEMSVSASIFIVAVILFRFLLMHKVPKMTFIVLWGFVLLRLFIPMSLPSPLSIYTAVSYLEEITAVQETAAPLMEGSSSILHNSTIITPSKTDSMAMPTVPSKSASTISPFMLVWFIGFIALALFFLLPHLRSRNHYKMSLPIESNFIRNWQQSNPIWRKVQIRQSDQILTPLTYGIFMPVVLLPKNIDFNDEDQLGLILTHEYIHIKRFDTLKKWLLAASVCVHWFNPFVWIMYILANRDIELSCDEKVIWTCGESMKPVYAMALVCLEEKKSGFSSLVSHFSKSSTEERIIAIMKTKKISMTTMLLAIVIVVGSVIVFATSAPDKTEFPSGADNPLAESMAVPSQYQYLGKVESTTSLMPIDLTYTRADVPMLIERLNASKYRAVYMDNEMYLRVTKENSIEISKDSGENWSEHDADVVSAKEFAHWLLKYDTNPGYSMKELQSRLAEGAEVKHLVLRDGKEMYFVIDKFGVQIELVQHEYIASVLLDGQRMMITFKKFSLISAKMLKSFNDLLASNQILTETEAEQDYAARIADLKKNDTLFTITDLD